MPDTSGLEAKVITPRRDTAALLSLLGDHDDRLRFWETLKGITTPAQYRLVPRDLDGMRAQVRGSARSFEAAAKQMGTVRAG